LFTVPRRKKVKRKQIIGIEEDPYRDYPHIDRSWSEKDFRRNGVAPVPWAQLILAALFILLLYWRS